MSDPTTLPDVEPKAVMTEDELKAWESLPAEVQLERLRAAIEKGIESGISSRSVDDIPTDVLARHSDAAELVVKI